VNKAVLTSDSIGNPKPDRRKANRLIVPPCRDCGSDRTRIVSRLEYSLYITCANCGLVWGVPRPEDMGEPL
jgi:hypothetical protein